MPHALVFDMPVKTSLKFMPSVGSDRADPEGKFFNHIIDELDRTSLVMLRIDRNARIRVASSMAVY